MLQGSETLAFFPKVLGNTMNIHQEILSRLKNRLKLTQANAEHNSDVIIAFVPVVSRAGTDIEAALEKIPRTGRPVVLMVLHFTFDVNYIPPQSNQIINRDDVFALDLLCYEDLGLLRSLRNDEALKAVTDHLISIGGSPHTQLGTTSSQTPCNSSLFTICIISSFIIVIIFTLFFIYLWKQSKHIVPTLQPDVTVNITSVKISVH